MLEPDDHATHRTDDGRPALLSTCDDCAELMRAAFSALVLREYLRLDPSIPTFTRSG